MTLTSLGFCLLPGPSTRIQTLVNTEPQPKGSQPRRPSIPSAPYLVVSAWTTLNPIRPPPRGVGLDDPQSHPPPTSWCRPGRPSIPSAPHLVVSSWHWSAQPDPPPPCLQYHPAMSTTPSLPDALILRSSCRGFLADVRMALTHGADVNFALPDGFTSLMAASERGYVDICRLLLTGGADVQLRNQDGYTALHFASEGGAPYCLPSAACRGQGGPQSG